MHADDPTPSRTSSSHPHLCTQAQAAYLSRDHCRRQSLFSMDPPDSKSTHPPAPNRPSPPVSGVPAYPIVSTSTSTSTAQTTPKIPIPPLPWASQNTIASASNASGPSFPQFSAATAEILKRLQANQGNATAGTAAFEAKRAEVLQNYVTSDKLPTPPPVAGAGRRGRGARVGTPLKPDGVAGSATQTPASGRGSGRGRGRGRGGGKGGKRKRADSVDSDVNHAACELLHCDPLTANRTSLTSLPRTRHCPHEQSLAAT